MGSSALLTVVLVGALLWISAIHADSEDDGKLLCACENAKGTCVNGTCRGDICFYTWWYSNEERGCFSAVNYREQCFTSFDRFFVHCCKDNLCNTDTTPPPNINGVPTTTPPELSRPELWITLSLLLLITTVSVCGLVLFLRFRRAHGRLRNVEDHDVTMLKVPNGDEPTYGEIGRAHV